MITGYKSSDKVVGFCDGDYSDCINRWQLKRVAKKLMKSTNMRKIKISFIDSEKIFGNRFNYYKAEADGEIIIEKPVSIAIDKLASEIEGFNLKEPEGAFYIFPECNSYFGKSHNGKTIQSSTDLAMFLLEDAHVACVGGDAFGAKNCIRMSYATSEEQITEAFKRISASLKKFFSPYNRAYNGRNPQIRDQPSAL